MNMTIDECRANEKANHNANKQYDEQTARVLSCDVFATDASPYVRSDCIPSGVKVVSTGSVELAVDSTHLPSFILLLLSRLDAKYW